MLIVQGYNAVVKNLQEDAFNVLTSLYKYMKSKAHDNDLAHNYYNYKKTNLDYWGNGYQLIEKLVHLPPSKRKEIIFVVYAENNDRVSFFYYFHKQQYKLELYRKEKEVHKIMDRIKEIFRVEDERRPLVKKWKYLTYIMS